MGMKIRTEDPVNVSLRSEATERYREPGCILSVVLGSLALASRVKFGKFSYGKDFCYVEAAR
jgi:hypothetical protein